MKKRERKIKDVLKKARVSDLIKNRKIIPKMQKGKRRQE